VLTMYSPADLNFGCRQWIERHPDQVARFDVDKTTTASTSTAGGSGPIERRYGTRAAMAGQSKLTCSRVPTRRHSWTPSCLEVASSLNRERAAYALAT